MAHQLILVTLVVVVAVLVELVELLLPRTQPRRGRSAWWWR